MKTLFKTLAILLVLACPTLEFDCGAEFAKFVETFSKTYDSDAEKNAREIIFCENLQSYEDWNNDPSHSYKKGVHSRSDWTAE